MSEQELRDGLRSAVADEPALAFDPNALIERAQRETKRRRSLYGAGLATVAVAVAAVGVPTLLGSPRPGANAGGPGWATDCASASETMPPDFPIPSGEPGVVYLPDVPSSGADAPVSPTGTPTKPSATPTPPKSSPSRKPPPSPEPTMTPEPSDPPEPCPPSGSSVPAPSASGSAAPDQPTVYFDWPPAGINKRTYTAAELRKHGEAMRTFLRDSFAKIVPGATDVTVDEFGGEASGAVSDGQGYLDSFVHFASKNGRTAVDVAVFAPGQGSPPGVVCGQGSCTSQDRPDGKLLTTTIPVGPGGKASIVTVSHYRFDGSVVMISGYNYDPSSQKRFEVLPAMPVDQEQLVALATDFHLGL